MLMLYFFKWWCCDVISWLPWGLNQFKSPWIIKIFLLDHLCGVSNRQLKGSFTLAFYISNRVTTNSNSEGCCSIYVIRLESVPVQPFLYKRQRMIFVSIFSERNAIAQGGLNQTTHPNDILQIKRCIDNLFSQVMIHFKVSGAV